MANKKVQRNKAASTQAEAGPASLWLAGVGAVSIARKRGSAMLGEFVAEGRRQQAGAVKLVREARTDLRAQVTGWIAPLRAELKQSAAKAGRSVEGGIAGALARLGIPSKSDIDGLAQRVAALSRQLKAAK